MVKWKLLIKALLVSFLTTFILSWSVTFVSIGNRFLSEDFVKIILLLISPLFGVIIGHLYYIKQEKPKLQLLFGFLYYLIAFCMCLVVSLSSTLFVIGAPPS